MERTTKFTFGWLGCAMILFLCAGGLAISPIGCLLLRAVGHMTVREHVTVDIPNTPYSIKHSRIGINAVVAEYNRDVTYLKNGVAGRTTPLAIDTCGGYPINCYLLQSPTTGPLLRLDDAVSEHLLDLKNEKTYTVERVCGAAYIGELTNERSTAGWSMSGNDPSTISVEVNGVPASPMATLTSGATEIYLGRLDGKFGALQFIPASESPEIGIDHLRDR